VPADFDGDGKADRAIYRRATGWWHILKSTGGSLSVEHGWPWTHSTPVPGDYNGDGLCSASTISGSSRALGGVLWQGRLIKWARTHTVTMRRRRSSPSTIRRLLCDVVTLVRLALTARAQLSAENLFLRKQLALYQERGVKPSRPDPETRAILVLLSRLLDWRSILTVVKPDTLIRCHRQGWRLFWRWKSRPGRPPIPRDLQLILRIAWDRAFHMRCPKRISSCPPVIAFLNTQR